jgi:hypothetical protein
MRPTTRLTAVLGATALLGLLLPASSAYADGSHTCFYGTLGERSGGEYEIAANGCDGSGYGDALVTVHAGSAAGTHHCRIVFPWNGSLGAQGCTPT